MDLKKMRGLVNDSLFTRMSKYNPIGQKKDDYMDYQMLNFLDKNIGSVEEDKIDEYSVILGRIHRWVTQAIDLRIEDVRNRRDTIAVLKYEREQAVTEDLNRTEKREASLEEKQQEHEEKENENAKKFADDQDSADEEGNPIQKLEYERQDLNLEEFNIEYDTLNPPVEIPSEVEDHIDNDFDMPYSPPDMQQE